jgi:hypothetical protein
MLETEAPTGVLMYLALTGSAAQERVLSAVADARLPDTLKARFVNIQKIIRKRAKERNRVVHCLWMVSDDYPDCLVHCPLDAEIQDIAWALHDRMKAKRLHMARPEFLAALSLYEKRDFDETEQRIAECAADVITFVQEVIAAKPAGWIPPLSPMPVPEGPEAALRPRKRRTSPAKPSSPR